MAHRTRPRSVRNLLVVVVFAVVGAMPLEARASSLLDKLDAALVSLLNNPLDSLARVRVIVSAKPGQLGSLLLTLRLGGYTILNERPQIEAVTIETPLLLLTTLSGLNLVQSISLDAPPRVLDSTDETSTTGQRLLATLGLSGTGYTGAGIGVAVVDSGLLEISGPLQ
jgi:hypothetical protein